GANGFPDARLLLSQDADLGMKGAGGSLARIATTTIDGITHTPAGLLNAAVYDIQHPMEIVKTVAGSAAIAAALKVVLPEAGPVGKIAGLAMGAWFIAETVPAFADAYKTGLSAKTWSQMQASGEQWGNAAGHLGVNTALGIVGYKIGAGISGNILSRE